MEGREVQSKTGDTDRSTDLVPPTEDKDALDPAVLLLSEGLGVPRETEGAPGGLHPHQRVTAQEDQSRRKGFLQIGRRVRSPLKIKMTGKPRLTLPMGKPTILME